MATRTASVRGSWNSTATWGGAAVPVNGDTVIINEGIEVYFNVDQSGWANGLAAMTLNGMLTFSTSTNTCLKMNGNITGSGALVVGYADDFEHDCEDWVKKDGYTNVYECIVAWDYPSILKFFEVEGVNYSITDYELVDSIEEVDTTPGSYYINYTGTDHTEFYVHTLDSDSPIGSHKVWIYYPIERPGAGSEYRTYILFNSSGTINLPTIKAFAWYPEIEYTTLSANASNGQAVIVLTEDLDLQQGDVICIGSGTEYGATVEASRGIYTVQSYVKETKTVTLTGNLATNRLAGDYVARVSRPITIARSSGTTNFCSTTIDDVVLIGVNLKSGGHLFYTNTAGDYFERLTVKHCTNQGRYIVYGCINSYFEKCTNTSTSGYPLYSGISNNTIKDSISIHGNGLGYDGSPNTLGENCITQNSGYMATNDSLIIKDWIVKNSTSIIGYSSAMIMMDNVEFDVIIPTSLVGLVAIELGMFDCTFKSTCRNLFGEFNKLNLYNCIFEEGYTIYTGNGSSNFNIQSFDHNRVPGNYMAWCKGGTIETLQEMD